MLEYSSYYQSQTCVHGEKKVTQKLTFRQIQYNFFYINTLLENYKRRSVYWIGLMHLLLLAPPIKKFDPSLNLLVLEIQTTKGEIIEKSLKVYFAANPHFLWKHFVFGDFGITRGISKWCKHNFLDLSIFVQYSSKLGFVIYSYFWTGKNGTFYIT